jgi:4-amino-4-deoxy-L-arabinose transferase-like glycosyltransferase
MLVLAGALLLRLAAVPAVHAVHYTSDEREYIHMAGQLLDDGVFRDSNGNRSIRAPLYPFLLAGLFWVSGKSLLFAHVAGCLLGTAIVWLVHALALRMQGDARTALMASGIAALYPGLVIYSALLQTETLYICFFLAALLLLSALMESIRFGDAAWLGLVSGLAALTRAVFAGFIPVVLLLIAWRHRGAWRRALPALAIVAVAAAVTIAPWTMRNMAVLHAFVPVASGGGSSLLTGNNPYATGTFAVRDGFDAWFASEAAARGVPDPSGLDETAKSSVCASIALSYIARYPGAAIELAAKKSYIFWVYPIAHTDSYVPVQALAVGADALLLAAVVMGIAASGIVKGRRAPLVAAVIYFWLVQAVLHAEARFRLPLIPLLAVLAGAGIVLLADRARLRTVFTTPGRRRWVIGGIAAIGLVYCITGVLFLRGKI